jgi:hypothetical protein
MRKKIEQKLGITDAANRITFYYYDANKKQYIIPLASLPTFAFDIIKGLDGFLFLFSTVILTLLI